MATSSPDSLSEEGLKAPGLPGDISQSSTTVMADLVLIEMVGEKKTL